MPNFAKRGTFKATQLCMHLVLEWIYSIPKTVMDSPSQQFQNIRIDFVWKAAAPESDR